MVFKGDNDNPFNTTNVKTKDGSFYVDFKEDIKDRVGLYSSLLLLRNLVKPVLNVVQILGK